MSGTASPTAAAAEPRRAAVAFIMITMLLDVLALGITIPILPKLVEGMLGGDTGRAAIIYALFTSAWALMQFLFQPLMGALSDRFGRRPVILFSNLGLGLDYILVAMAPNLWWLFVGRVISGIAASSFSCATAYITDVTPPEKRAEKYGLVGVMFGVGFVAGPALGGLLGSIDPRLPLWVAAGFSLANAVYGYFILPESLAPENRARFLWKNANPIGSLHLLRRHHVLLGLSGTLFLYHLVHNVYAAVFVLHASYRFGWGEGMVGAALAGFAVCAAVVQGLLIKPAVGRFGERTTLLIGIGFGVAGFIILGLADRPWLFWLGMPVIAFWNFAGPSMQQIMSRYVEPSEQGQLQGANGALMGIAGLFGPSIFAQLFAFAIAWRGKDFSGAPYLLAALLLLASGVIAWRATKSHRPTSPMDRAS